MKSILVKDTTREERAAIVAEAIGNTEGACDGCAPGIVRMYDEYIEGRMELKEVTELCLEGMRPHAEELGLMGTEA